MIQNLWLVLVRVLQSFIRIHPSLSPDLGWNPGPESEEVSLGVK